MTPQGPSPTDAQLDAACEWFARLRCAEPDGELAQAFAAWLAQDEAHKAAFDATAALFEDPVLDALTSASSAAVETNVVSMAAARTSQGAARTSKGAASPRRWWPLAAAAGVAALAIAVLWTPDVSNTYHSDVGQQLAVRLDDGSQLTLNTDTQVQVTLSASRRQIQLLRGEAWFDVAHATRRPFSVAAADVTVTAVGTAFSVQQAANRTLVDLAQGQVLVAAAGGSTNLLPGQRAHVDATGNIQVSAVDSSRMATWRRQMLVYEGVSLAELVADLNRYMPADMEISDPTLAATEVSAILRIADQATMLEALTHSLDLRWESTENDRIVLYPASVKPS